MKGTLLKIEEESYNHILAFSFYLYFHIRSRNKNISFINVKMGMAQDVVHIFPTAQLSLLQFWDDTIAFPPLRFATKLLLENI